MLDTVVFDVDGTLVDSNYHHLIAWERAFASVGVVVPGWRLHAALGMGGDHLVGEVAGDRVERAVGEEVRTRWKQEYDSLLEEVRPFPNAVEALEAFRHTGARVVLATSGNEDHVDRTLEILDLTRGDYPLVSSADVEGTRPEPDLVGLALDAVGGNAGVMVGDTVWDVEAGDRAGVPVIGVLTGGISEDVLRDAGALRVFADVDALRVGVPEVVRLFGRASAASGH